MILVYALTSSRGSRGRGGMPPPLRRVTVGSIAAVVETVKRPPKPTERALRRFDGVLRSLAAATPALLPVRFGTAIADLDELTFILQARQQTLRRNLRSVRGRVQMTVRMADSLLPASSTQLPVSNSERPTPGTAYLRARAAERDVPGFAPVRAAVRRWVKDERVEKRGRLASVYHLVPRGSVSAYRRALEAAARDAGLRVVVSGPWPPYAFSSPF